MAARKTGRAFIVDCNGVGYSPAMLAFYSHACDWLQTVDALAYGGGLPLADAVRVADAGYRGDNIRRARRVLSELERECN